MLHSRLRISIHSDLLLSGFLIKTSYIILFSLMNAKCIAHHILLEIFYLCLVESTSNVATHAIYLKPSILSSLFDSNLYVFTSVTRSQIPPIYVPPFLKRPSFTPMQNYIQNYSSVYLNFVFREQMRRQQFLN
jgi:hypothetical protein